MWLTLAIIGQGGNMRRENVLNNDNGSGDRKGNHRRKVVERWETLEVLHSGRESMDKVDIALVIEIKQPVFEGGSRGFPKMNATLSRGERFLRFTCFDGDISEINALADLLNGAVDVISGFSEIYGKYVEKHKADYQRGSSKKQGGGVGGGLSRDRTGEGKTARKRRRKRVGADNGGDHHDTHNT
jgi:hypothetical protein